MKHFTLFFLTLTLISTPAFSVEIHPKAGTTAATFLTLGAGSRAAAMGGAFAGLADDVTALYWNPAGLARLANTEVHLTHNEQFEGIRQDFAGYATPFGKGVIGGALYGLYTPVDIERRSGNSENDPFMPLSNSEGLFGAYDTAAQLSYARVINGRLSAGASLLAISQTIDNYTAYGAAMDLGLQYGLKDKPVSLGLALQHIGTPIKFISKSYDLPFNVKAGGAWFPKPNLKVTCDLNQPIDNWLSASLGSEYCPNRYLALRAGYNYLLYGQPLGDAAGIAAGVGFIIPWQKYIITVDYAFQPYGVLGNSNRISVGIEFPGRAPVRPAPISAPSNTTAPVKVSTTSAVTIQAPPLPSISPISQAGATGADFTVHATSTTVELRQIAGRTVIYSIKAEAATGDIRRLTAMARSQALLREVSIKFSQERTSSDGKAGTYRRYMIEKNCPAQFSNITIEMSLPVSLHEPFIRSKEAGSPILPRVISKENDSATYQFTLPSLEPFSVETHE